MATARLLLNTFAAWRAPCSVNARGGLVRPPRVGFDITFCDINVPISSSLNWKAKSAGNPASFRFTAWFKAAVVTTVNCSEIRIEQNAPATNIVDQLLNRWKRLER